MTPTIMEVFCCLFSQRVDIFLHLCPFKDQPSAVQMSTVTQRIECSLEMKKTGFMNV